MGQIHLRRTIPAAPEEVYSTLVDLERLGALVEPDFQLKAAGKVECGALLEVEVSRFQMIFKSQIRIETLEPARGISYRQTRGFFEFFRHSLRLEKVENSAEIKTALIEDLEFRLPFGIFGAIMDDFFVYQAIRKVLIKRTKRLEALLQESVK